MNNRTELGPPSFWANRDFILLSSQPAGVLAYRLNRKKILIPSEVIRFVLLALFSFTDNVWQIYALIFAINAVTVFFTPTFEAMLPEVAGLENYVKALSFSRIAADIEAVAAPSMAGLPILLMELRCVFLFGALTFLASAGLVYILRSEIRHLAVVVRWRHSNFSLNWQQAHRSCFVNPLCGRRFC